MIDMPFPVRAIEGDALGQAAPGLPEAALIVLAQEVIRRLAHWATETVTVQSTGGRAQQEPDIDALCKALVGIDPNAARVMIREVHNSGASHEEICLYYIGAAATRLGEMWDHDQISYPDMALAAGRMLLLLRDLRDLAPPFEPKQGRCALFAAVPGENHVLGVTMAADLFRDDGWDIALRLDASEARLVEMVQREGYPIVGLSAASIERVRALARVIVALRIAAPKILIFVGGAIVRLDPDIALRVGADAAGWRMEHCKQEMLRLHRMLPDIMATPRSS